MLHVAQSMVGQFKRSNQAAIHEEPEEPERTACWSYIWTLNYYLVTQKLHEKFEKEPTMRITPKICSLCVCVVINKRSFYFIFIFLTCFGSRFRMLAVILDSDLFLFKKKLEPEWYSMPLEANISRTKEKKEKVLCVLRSVCS